MTITPILLEPRLAAHLKQPGPNDSGIDLISTDGNWGVEIASNLSGSRELSAHILDLGRWLARNPKKRALLVLMEPRMSQMRLAEEWDSMKDVLHESIIKRMAIVTPEGRLPQEESPAWLEILKGTLVEARNRKTHVLAPLLPALSRKSFEVIKLLLYRWLRHLEPVHVLELARQTGCSYPTVSKALARLNSQRELSRTTDRRVHLPDFPRRTWGEAVAQLRPPRETVSFLDASGRPPEPFVLLKRLHHLGQRQVAVGGVEAARHWDPHFDLHGLPRLDLLVHAPDEGQYDLRFVQRLDPALRQVPAGDPRTQQEIVLAVHRLSRKESLFDNNPDGTAPWADPVETLLDLHELGLDTQAQELIERLRTVAA